MLLKKALKLGATTLKRSNRKNKKWAVLYKNTWIHFGDSRYQDFTQHGDHIRRTKYRKRHRAIRLKDGRLAYMVKTQPSFWAYNLIW